MSDPLPDLPVTAALPQVINVLAHTGRAILQAPPGSGKTTRVPLALVEQASLAGKKILMLIPRRQDSRCDQKMPVRGKMYKGRAEKILAAARNLARRMQVKEAELEQVPVKKDLAGRYPRHFWPDAPLSAVATRRARPRKK